MVGLDSEFNVVAFVLVSVLEGQLGHFLPASAVNDMETVSEAAHLQVFDSGHGVANIGQKLSSLIP